VAKEMNRESLTQSLAEIILGLPCPHPLRVAIDGVDAAGKTTLSEELALTLKSQPRQVIRVSVDGFHQPKLVRRQLGDLSPEGFYRDSYDYKALIENLLVPLGPDGNRQYRDVVFDVRQDRPVETPFQTAEPGAILLMDGIFLLRPTLLPFWDLTLFLHADFETTFSRGIKRDSAILGSPEETQRRYRERYIPGQQLYLADAHPLDTADIVIDNNDLDAPKFIRPDMDRNQNRLPETRSCLVRNPSSS
jgi:uridine kinase